MPTVLDATVVNSAYDTSGNGGRKLVRLDNGWLVASAKDTAIRLYVSKDNGNTFTQLCFANIGSTPVDFAISSYGTNVFLVYTFSSQTQFLKIDALTITNTDIVASRVPIDSSQSTLGNVSLVTNATGTELHATWASKNATYPNSFNIRYAKGTINADGSVTWGAVEQVTKMNSTTYPNAYINPTITLDKVGNACIVVESIGIFLNGTVYDSTSTGRSILMIKKNELTAPPASYSDWTYSQIYGNNSSYAQSSPSAIFVPQSVNGRIWVAWHGLDSSDTAKNNIRVSYSDDGGTTWSAMQKVSTGNVVDNYQPSITANKSNRVFIVWHGDVTANAQRNVFKSEYNGTSWSSKANVTNKSVSGALYPSSLFDSTFSLSFSEPLFIYQDTQLAKVGFYGTWTTTTISVTQGSIGQKTDKANVLTYAITTDGVMSTITEKVNGVTVGTKTATSGQSQIVGLSQAQWDAVINGKYKDVTGGLNTLTIEMGSETFTYTFDKRPATDADMISVAKAVQDSANVYLPAVKSELASAIRAKGGTVNDADALEVMASAVGSMPVKRYLTGTITSSSTGIAFVYAGSTSTSTSYSVTVTGLTFKPSKIVVYQTANTGNPYYTIYTEAFDGFYAKTAKMFSYNGTTISAGSFNIKGDVAPASVTSTGFVLPVGVASVLYTWEAFE